MDIRKFNTKEEAYKYWRELIENMPEGYDLAYKIVGIAGNDNFARWTQEDLQFDKIVDLALLLERNPDNHKTWVEMKALIIR